MPRIGVADEEKRFEKRVQSCFEEQLTKYGIRFFTDTEYINSEIEDALKSAPSKSGGRGKNYPDLRVMIESSKGRVIPVMLEAKGKKGDLIKYDKNGEIELVKKFKTDSKPDAVNPHKAGDNDYSTIMKYAVNGAVHYAKAILDYGKTYNECLAIGLNGWKEVDGNIKLELGVYYISKENYGEIIKVDDYTDLSFLKKENIDDLIVKLDSLALSDEERERKTAEIETELDAKLRKINQIMQDTIQINVSYRVNLICGMIMAGIGYTNHEGQCIVKPLELSDLKGSLGKKDNDGVIFLNKIEAFLEEQRLPVEKKDLIINTLSATFIGQHTLYEPINGESKLKSIYGLICSDILPIFRSKHHLDFTGKLFNVLNEWVAVPDGDLNDVVFTPRYVTDLMAKLAKVDKDSYVWDYCAGSGGFLVSSMKLMLEDAKNTILNPDELRIKERNIRENQLLGIEKLPDIYMLAVLNMILMGDGASHILQKDSLLYDGKYEQGENKDDDFPADVFLLNPPYSADGKGFVFVARALSKMKKGRAVVLIQENAGKDQGKGYTKEILRNNTLVASIHMPDIFKGKASVQTAIYVFDVGVPHNEKSIVKFINFTNDGYTRQNRKKSSQDVNLKNTDHAKERYAEIVDLVNYGKHYLHYFTEADYVEDTISLNGNDWTFAQHQKVDTTPTIDDFKKTVADYLTWKVSAIMKEGVGHADC